METPDHRMPRKWPLAAAAGLAGLVLLRTLAVIPAGHVGVVDLFGRVSSHPLMPGMRLKNPLARVIRMSVMTRQAKELLEVPYAEGLTMQLEASVVWHLDAARAPEVYRTLGLDYFSVLVEPEFRAVTRTVTARHDARALYTSERERAGQMLTGELRERLAPRGVVIEAVPL